MGRDNLHNIVTVCDGEVAEWVLRYACSVRDTAEADCFNRALRILISVLVVALLCETTVLAYFFFLLLLASSGYLVNVQG